MKPSGDRYLSPWHFTTFGKEDVRLSPGRTGISTLRILDLSLPNPDQITVMKQYRCSQSYAINDRTVRTAEIRDIEAVTTSPQLRVQP
jgi:hypothetical protein